MHQAFGATNFVSDVQVHPPLVCFQQSDLDIIISDDKKLILHARTEYGVELILGDTAKLRILTCMDNARADK